MRGIVTIKTEDGRAVDLQFTSNRLVRFEAMLEDHGFDGILRFAEAFERGSREISIRLLRDVFAVASGCKSDEEAGDLLDACGGFAVVAGPLMQAFGAAFGVAAEKPEGTVATAAGRKKSTGRP